MQPYNPSKYGDTGGYCDRSKHVESAAPPAPPARVRVSALARSSEAIGSFYDGGRWQLCAKEAPRVFRQLRPEQIMHQERVWRKEWIRKQQTASGQGGSCAAVAASVAGSHPRPRPSRVNAEGLMHGSRRNHIKSRRWHVRLPQKQQRQQQQQQQQQRAGADAADGSTPEVAINLELADERRFSRISYDEWLRRKRQQQQAARATAQAIEHARVECESKRQERVNGAFDKWRAKKQRESARVRAEALKQAEVKKQADKQQQERCKARRARAERLRRKLSAKRRRTKRASSASNKLEPQDAENRPPPAGSDDRDRLTEETYAAWLKRARRRDAQRAAQQRRQSAVEAQQRKSMREAKWRKKEVVLCYTRQLPGSTTTMQKSGAPTM